MTSKDADGLGRVRETGSNEKSAYTGPWEATKELWFSYPGEPQKGFAKATQFDFHFGNTAVAAAQKTGSEQEASEATGGVQ